MNMSRLASWIRRYNLDDNKTWKQIIDFKYDTESPNVVSCRETDTSPFWKGVMWASRAAQMGYEWIVRKLIRSGSGRTNGLVKPAYQLPFGVFTMCVINRGREYKRCGMGMI
jgi:hypothetical protein